MVAMTVLIEGTRFYMHPQFKGYGCDVEGNIINIKTKKRPKQSVDESGYCIVNLAWIFRKRTKYMRCVFNYECFNNCILDDITMHANRDTLDDRPCNLICLP